MSGLEILAFLLGLLLGLTLLSWQKARLDKKLDSMLLNLSSGGAEVASLASISKLSLAIAYHQKVQEKLELQIETYKQIFYLAPIGYLQVDDENRLLWCNPQAQSLLGIAHVQLSEPRLLLELVRSYDLDQLIDRTRSTGQPSQADWMFYRVNPNPSQLSKQESCALRGHGFPLSGDQVAIFLENRQEAIVLRQQRDRWASDVAHELKTPLTSIRLVAETLQNRLDSSYRGWMERLINETIRLSNLVQDLLDLGQLDRHSSDCLNVTDTDLVDLIHSAWLNLEPLARKKNVQLDYLGPDQLLVQLDKQRIYRVLINLLDNAIKYSPPWQNVRVKLNVDAPEPLSSSFYSYSSQVLLEIVDAGPGFHEADLPFIFERFYRADLARSRNLPEIPSDSQQIPQNPPHSQTEEASLAYRETQESIDGYQRSSSGLGLSIVQQIVEAHHGSVSASNHPETRGAWLQIRLPLLRAYSQPRT